MWTFQPYTYANDTLAALKVLSWNEFAKAIHSRETVMQTDSAVQELHCTSTLKRDEYLWRQCFVYWIQETSILISGFKYEEKPVSAYDAFNWLLAPVKECQCCFPTRFHSHVVMQIPRAIYLTCALVRILRIHTPRRHEVCILLNSIFKWIYT